MSYKELLIKHWGHGLWWLFCSTVAMLGLWGTGLAVFFFLENPPWLQLVDRGQFFLYSVGFLGHALYILTKDFRVSTIPLRRVLLGSTLGCLLVCTVIFGGSVLSNFSGEPEVSRVAVLRYLGLAILLFSVFIGFLVNIADEERGPVDYPALGETGVRRLEGLIPEGSEE